MGGPDSAWVLSMGYGRSMTPQGWTHGLRLGLRSLWRDVRAGELRLLMLSVSLAVAALTAVGFLSDRMQSGLWRDARQLLGGDVVVVSDQATPALVLQTAQRLGLQFNTSVSFPTMARALPEQGGASKLVALKAVTQGYPLRGQLEVQHLHAAGANIPPQGEVWVDGALLDALGERFAKTIEARLALAPGSDPVASYAILLEAVMVEFRDFRFLYRDQRSYGEHGEVIAARAPEWIERTYRQLEIGRAHV